MKYIFWDIDGTLLLTARAGIDALKESIKLRFHKDDFDFSHGLAGRTDSFIIKRAITDIKGKCDAADAAGLLITYNQLLPKYLESHKGKVMPNVKTTLEYLKNNCPQWHSTLLTGNCSRAAYDKLVHYGLYDYFDFSLSAFGELSEERDMLAKALVQKIYITNPKIDPARDIIVIGDTPHDVKCAKAIGAKCLIVLAGSFYNEEEVKKENPWKIIPKLPDKPEDFLKIINQED